MALEETAAVEGKDAAAAPAAKDGAPTEGKTSGQVDAATATGDKAAPPVGDAKVVTDATKEPVAKDAKKTDAGSLLDEGDEGEAEDGKEPAAKDGKAAKPAGDWGTTRSKAIDKHLAKIEAGLKKTVTAADLPKEMAKVRSKLETQLGRYASVEDALLAGFAAQEKIRSGGVKEKLADDATPEEITEWRAANGIPETPDGYQLAKIDGHTWTEADKPALEKLKERAHALNFDGKAINGVAQLYAELVQEAQQAQAESIAERDALDYQATRDVLRDELRGEYKGAMAVAKRVLKDPDLFPAGMGEALAQARLPDGQRLILNADYLRALVRIGKERHGEGRSETGEQAQASQSEAAEIEALMNTDIDAYRHKPWKTTGKTASERLLEIRREEAARGKGRRAA